MNYKKLRRADFVEQQYEGRPEVNTRAHRTEALTLINERRSALYRAIADKLRYSSVLLNALPSFSGQYNEGRRYVAAVLWEDFVSGAVRLRRVPSNEPNFEEDVVYYAGKHYRFIETIGIGVADAPVGFDAKYNYPNTKADFFSEIPRYSHPVVTYGDKIYTAIKTVDQRESPKLPTNEEYWQEIDDLSEFFGRESTNYVMTFVDEYGQESRPSRRTNNVLFDVGQFNKLLFMPIYDNSSEFPLSSYNGELWFYYPCHSIWQVYDGDSVSLKRCKVDFNILFPDFNSEQLEDAAFGSNIYNVDDSYGYFANFSLGLPRITNESGDEVDNLLVNAWDRYGSQYSRVYLYDGTAYGYGILANIWSQPAHRGKWIRAKNVSADLPSGEGAFHPANYGELDFIRIERVGGVDKIIKRHISELVNYESFSPVAGSFEKRISDRKLNDWRGGFPVLLTTNERVRLTSRHIPAGELFTYRAPNSDTLRLYRTTSTIPASVSVDELITRAEEIELWIPQNESLRQRSTTLFAGQYSARSTSSLTGEGSYGITSGRYYLVQGRIYQATASSDLWAKAGTHFIRQDSNDVRVTTYVWWSFLDVINGGSFARSEADQQSRLVTAPRVLTLFDGISYTELLTSPSVVGRQALNGVMGSLSEEVGDFTINDYRGRLVRINQLDGDPENDLPLGYYLLQRERTLGTPIPTQDPPIVAKAEALNDTGDFIRIYRYSTRQQNYVLVGEQRSNLPFYKDYIISGYETELPFLATADYLEPPENVNYHAFTSDGRYVVAATNRVYISPPGVTHAFIRELVLPCSEVLGLVDTATGVIAITDTYPFIIRIRQEETLIVNINRYDLHHPCASPESVADMGEFAIYASHDGLVSVGDNRRALVTRDIFTQKQFKGINPTTIKGLRWGEHYLGVFERGDDESDPGAFLFDPIRLFFSWIDDFELSHYNNRNSLVYLTKNGDDKIYQFGQGESGGGVWRSGILKGNYTHIKAVFKGAGKVNINIYNEAGDLLQTIKDVANDDSNVLTSVNPRGERVFAVEVTDIKQELYLIALMRGSADNSPFVISDFTGGMSMALPPASVKAQWIYNLLPPRGVVKGADLPIQVDGNDVITRGDRSTAKSIFFNDINSKWYYLDGILPLVSTIVFDPFARLYFIHKFIAEGAEQGRNLLYFIDLYKLDAQDTEESLVIEIDEYKVYTKVNKDGEEVQNEVGGRVGFTSENVKRALDGNASFSVVSYPTSIIDLTNAVSTFDPTDEVNT